MQHANPRLQPKAPFDYQDQILSESQSQSRTKKYTGPQEHRTTRTPHKQEH